MNAPFDPRKAPQRELRVPDLIEAVEGWRVWCVDYSLPLYGVPPKLQSVTHNYYWAPRRAAAAECSVLEAAARFGVIDPDLAHEVPGERCTCGFYCAKTYEHLLSLRYVDWVDARGPEVVPVVGRVACWGKVIEGDQGWRSSMAYPHTL